MQKCARQSTFRHYEVDVASRFDQVVEPQPSTGYSAFSPVRNTASSCWWSRWNRVRPERHVQRRQLLLHQCGVAVLVSFAQCPYIFLSGRHMPENCSYCKTDPTLNCALASNAFHHMSTNADDGICNLRGCLACELDGVIQEMYTPGGSLGPVMPHRFIHALWLQSKNLAGYLQHDAHEFFICCIDELSKACDAYSKNSSYQLGPLFSGSCLSSVTCNTCGAVSGNEEIFRDISLDISGDCCDALSLDDCLRRFTRVETLDADVARVCPTCHGNLFSKELSFTRPPSLLCLHLKRFEHDASFGRFTKIDRHVSLVGHVCLMCNIN